MMLFKRDIQEKIERVLFKGKIVVVYGPRQTGKTTLSKTILAQYKEKGMYYDCQLADVRKCFIVGRPSELLPLTKGKKIVVFDEAQTIQNIGTILKLFHDTYPGTQIIATGSSSFDLANKIVEPMTGRAVEFTLLPLSLHEIQKNISVDVDILQSCMLYGSYPEVVAATSKYDKETAIKNIATNYLYKDIFILESIKNSKAFEDILKMLSLQVGNMVSVLEIARAVGVSRATVDRYLRLLEQSFIIKRVYSFSNNPRTELKKAFKVFFIDVGIRNALVDITTPMKERNDKGAIFENFFITERIKQGTLEVFSPEILFWRTRSGLEIDVIEKYGQTVTGYECKWSKTDVSFKDFLKKYPQAKVSVVTPHSLIEN